MNEILGMQRGTYTVDSMSTHSVQASDRVEYWVHLMQTTQFMMDIDYCVDRPFRGRLLRQATQLYKLDVRDEPGAPARRSIRHVQQFPDEDYRLVVMIAGTAVLSDGEREVEITPGSAALMTPTCPFEGRVGQSRVGMLTIPRTHVDSRLNLSAPVAAGVDLSRGLGRVVLGILSRLHEERTNLSARQFDAVCDRLVDLLCMLVVGDDRPNVEGHLGDVEATVRAHVRRHASDPELTGTTIARALGWSIRQIQLSLQQAGTTPRDLIREERLRLARELLESSAHRSRSIGEVALLSGFTSTSALSSAFRRRFGESPRDYRQHRTVRGSNCCRDSECHCVNMCSSYSREFCVHAAVAAQSELSPAPGGDGPASAAPR